VYEAAAAFIGEHLQLSHVPFLKLILNADAAATARRFIAGE
jgi:hypothetical protein